MLAVGGWLGYNWTQDQYYVGTDGTNVVVYQGISQDLGPIKLSSEAQVTGLALTSLQPVTQTQVKNTISATSKDDANRIVHQLQAEADSVGPKSSDGAAGDGASDGGR